MPRHKIGYWDDRRKKARSIVEAPTTQAAVELLTKQCKAGQRDEFGYLGVGEGEGNEHKFTPMIIFSEQMKEKI